ITSLSSSTRLCMSDRGDYPMHGAAAAEKTFHRGRASRLLEDASPRTRDETTRGDEAQRGDRKVRSKMLPKNARRKTDAGCRPDRFAPRSPPRFFVAVPKCARVKSASKHRPSVLTSTLVGRRSRPFKFYLLTFNPGAASVRGSANPSGGKPE